MKTLKAEEVYNQLIETLEKFKVTENKEEPPVRVVIENIGFIDLIIMNRIITHKKSLFMPGELDTECMTLVYQPIDGHTIILESEPCVKYTTSMGISKQEFINLN